MEMANSVIQNEFKSEKICGGAQKEQNKIHIVYYTEGTLIEGYSRWFLRLQTAY